MSVPSKGGSVMAKEGEDYPPPPQPEPEQEQPPERKGRKKS